MSMLLVNIMALAELTKLFADEMVKRGSGKILNVASTAGFQPGPMMSGYYASKAFVINYSQALAYELKPKGVTVSVLCRGPTISEFHQRAGMSGMPLVKRKTMMSAEEVARIGYNGLLKCKSLIIAGALNKIGVITSRFSPRIISMMVVNWLHTPRNN